VDRSAGDDHKEARKVAENHSLSLGQLCTQKRPKHILIQGNCAVDQFFLFNRAVAGKPIQAEIKEIEARRIFDVVGVYQDDAV
jgi:hypothetical protein